ncbi:hypothetical protein PAXINDRAFT_100784 [Paxillus involutus ATCC 200175]|uniref:Uncharacterized protein n=1 Tax=Paxillus involutus ATCC 200175 TaxID=664439 RepID=A0A0C9U0R6_PAXIN|nr:hypothetical protein PAXINDRAFT_100784 [Paxillus involutus ATCC 200175]
MPTRYVLDDEEPDQLGHQVEDIRLSASFTQEKDDLITFAAALTLPMEGMVADLTTCTKECLAANSQRADEPRFSALFSNGRKRNPAAGASIPLLTGPEHHSEPPSPHEHPPVS